MQISNELKEQRVMRDFLKNSACKKGAYRVARNFCGSLFLQLGDFLCFAGTNFCD